MSAEAAAEREKAGGKAEKAERTRRGRLRSIARKAAQVATQLEERAIREEEQTAADHAHVCELANRAMGGSFSTILKKSPLLTDEERAWLKELGYL